MNELTAGVSWLGVVVSFFASFMVGWLWYSPKLFGEKWAAGVGVQMDTAGNMPKLAMFTQILATFGLAWLYGITAAGNKLLTITLVLFTLIMFTVSNGKYAQKSTMAVGIEAAYMVVMGVIMLLCQGIF